MLETKKYTTGEEVANAITHATGALMAAYGMVILTMNSKNSIQAISANIFGATLFLLFISSVCYHSTTNQNLKKIFQKIDHSAIYMLIAGTYTPVLILTVKFPLSLVLVALIWGLALTGIVFSCTTIKTKALSTVLYLVMGWLSVFFIYSVWLASHLSVWLLLSGGLFYSLGCAFYLMKTRYMHSLWHIFVLSGAAMHFFAIMELLKVSN